IQNITQLDMVQSMPGSNSMVHNARILNDYSVTSWYKDGVVIFDVSHPGTMVKVGSYDTYEGYGPNNMGNIGCQDVYPFLPSGNIIATDISNGLFVLTP